MTREEELKKLEEISNYLCGMSDNEFCEYFYEGSPSFRRDFDAIKNTLDTDSGHTVVLCNNAEYQTYYAGSEYSASENSYQLTAAEVEGCLTAA